MASNRSLATRSVPTEESVEPQKEDARDEKSRPHDALPRAGRTGGLGARAERPSDGTEHQSKEKVPSPGRNAETPSAGRQRADK